LSAHKEIIQNVFELLANKGSHFITKTTIIMKKNYMIGFFLILFFVFWFQMFLVFYWYIESHYLIVFEKNIFLTISFAFRRLWSVGAFHLWGGYIVFYSLIFLWFGIFFSQIYKTQVTLTMDISSNLSSFFRNIKNWYDNVSECYISLSF